MSAKIAALLTVSLVCAAGSAQASYVYGYGGQPTYAGINGYAPRGTGIILTISDTTVERGSFTLRGAGGFDGEPPSYVGDVADFLSLTATGMANATPSSFAPYNDFSVSMTFDPASGAVLSDSVYYQGPTDEAMVSGTGMLTTGAIGSDGPWCNAGAAQMVCTVTGSWGFYHQPDPTQVPEPASLTLMLAGMVGAGALRQKTAKAVLLSLLPRPRCTASTP